MSLRRSSDLFAFAHDNRSSIVYVATNTNNGKRYIGITRLPLEKRRYAHLQNVARGMGGKFYTAIRKHGADAFAFSTLERCDTYKLAMAAEQRLIAELRPEYNLTLGGEGVLGHRHSKASRRKMARAKGGKGPWAKGQCPPEVRAKLSARAKTYIPPVLSPEVRRKISRLGNDARRRPVLCLNDGLAYASTTAAAAHYGITPVAVQYNCRGRFKTSRRGLRFVFVDESDW